MEYGTVFFTPRENTCDDPDLGGGLEPWSAAFTVYSDGDLLLQGGSFAAEYTKLSDEQADTAGPAGTSFRLGCWDDDELVYDE